MKKRTTRSRPALETQLAHVGNAPFDHDGIVNPPLYRASTVLFPTLEALTRAAADPYAASYYGRMGTPTSVAFERAMAALEGGDRAIATSSGLSAITGTLLSFLSAGDEILVTDAVYQSTRKFCDGVLGPLGITVRYYDPGVGGDIETLFTEKTRLVFMETPGSLTFEMQDVPAIVEAARRHDCLTVIDNTWATPLGFQPFDHGVDVSIQAATKYISGHADVMLGAIMCRHEHFRRIKTTLTLLGDAVAPDHCYLGLRGLRTLGVRLPRHAENALELAGWLCTRGEVESVFCPALPGDPGHDLWRRDFQASCGLFSCRLHSVSRAALAALLDDLELFHMGFSWGGYESLILPVNPQQCRTATQWPTGGPLLRIHAGLENIDDLKADLSDGFKRLGRAS